jgi:HK97 gp10 family phage protein
MPSTAATITGLDELNATMEALQKGSFEKAARKALRAAGTVIQAAIRERTPIRDDGKHSGTALPSGALAADINLSNVRHPGGTDAYQISVAPGKYTAHVARFVEYGHENAKGGGSTPAHPFIRPGYEASEAEASEVLVAVFLEEQTKLVNKT